MNWCLFVGNRWSHSSCSWLWIRLRNGVPVSASSRIPLSSAHGPIGPVPTKRPHFSYQVRKTSVCSRTDGSDAILTFFFYFCLFVRLFILFVFVFDCAGKSPKSWWTYSTKTGLLCATRGRKSSWNPTSSAIWRTFHSSRTDSAVRRLWPHWQPFRWIQTLSLPLHGRWLTNRLTLGCACRTSWTSL